MNKRCLNETDPAHYNQRVSLVAPTKVSQRDTCLPPWRLFLVGVPVFGDLARIKKKGHPVKKFTITITESERAVLLGALKLLNWSMKQRKGLTSEETDLFTRAYGRIDSAKEKLTNPDHEEYYE
jgi:hypothetical protein